MDSTSGRMPAMEPLSGHKRRIEGGVDVDDSPQRPYKRVAIDNMLQPSPEQVHEGESVGGGFAPITAMTTLVGSMLSRAGSTLHALIGTNSPAAPAKSSSGSSAQADVKAGPGGKTDVSPVSSTTSGPVEAIDLTGADADDHEASYSVPGSGVNSGAASAQSHLQTTRLPPALQPRQPTFTQSPAFGYQPPAPSGSSMSGFNPYGHPTYPYPIGYPSGYATGSTPSGYMPNPASYVYGYNPFAAPQGYMTAPQSGGGMAFAYGSPYANMYAQAAMGRSQAGGAQIQAYTGAGASSSSSSDGRGYGNASSGYMATPPLHYPYSSAANATPTPSATGVSYGQGNYTSGSNSSSGGGGGGSALNPRLAPPQPPPPSFPMTAADSHLPQRWTGMPVPGAAYPSMNTSGSSGGAMDGSRVAVAANRRRPMSAAAHVTEINLVSPVRSHSATARHAPAAALPHTHECVEIGDGDSDDEQMVHNTYSSHSGAITMGIKREPHVSVKTEPSARAPWPASTAPLAASALLQGGGSGNSMKPDPFYRGGGGGYVQSTASATGAMHPSTASTGTGSGSGMLRETASAGAGAGGGLIHDAASWLAAGMDDGDDDDDDGDDGDDGESVELDLSEVPNVPMGYAIAGKVLMTHQVDGVVWMLQHEHTPHRTLPRGGLLCDEVGLGKTIQTVTLITIDTVRIRTLLVLPKSVMCAWRRELCQAGGNIRVFGAESHPKWGMALREYRWNESGTTTTSVTPPLPFSVLEGTYCPDMLSAIRTGQKAVVTVTYGMCKPFGAQLQSDGSGVPLGGIVWDRIVMDEAQVARNPTTLTHKRLKALPLSPRASIWALTATPVTNIVGDALALFLLVGVDPVQVDLKGVFSRYLRSKSTKPVDDHAMHSMKRLMKQVSLMRGTRDIPSNDWRRMGFPEGDPIIEDRPVPFRDAEEEQTYMQVIDYVRNELAVKSKKLEGQALGSLKLLLLMYLRLLSVHPSLAIKAINKRRKDARQPLWPKWEKPTSKNESVLEHVAQLKEAGDNIVIFTHFNIELDYFVKGLTELRYQVFTLTGADSMEKRDEIVQDTRSIPTYHDLYAQYLAEERAEAGLPVRTAKPATSSSSSAAATATASARDDTAADVACSVSDGTECKPEDIECKEADACARAAARARAEWKPVALVANIKAGGTGLNLQHFHQGVMPSPDWTSVAETQAVGRLHRIGQRHQVKILKLHVAAVDQAEENIEPRMKDTQARKSRLIDMIVECNMGYILDHTDLEDEEEME